MYRPIFVKATAVLPRRALEDSVLGEPGQMKLDPAHTFLAATANLGCHSLYETKKTVMR